MLRVTLCCLGTLSKWKWNSFCALSKLLRKLLWICVAPVEPKPALGTFIQCKLRRAACGWLLLTGSERVLLHLCEMWNKWALSPWCWVLKGLLVCFCLFAYDVSEVIEFCINKLFCLCICAYERIACVCWTYIWKLTFVKKEEVSLLCCWTLLIPLCNCRDHWTAALLCACEGLLYFFLVPLDIAVIQHMALKTLLQDPVLGAFPFKAAHFTTGMPNLPVSLWMGEPDCFPMYRASLPRRRVLQTRCCPHCPLPGLSLSEGLCRWDRGTEDNDMAQMALKWELG